MDRFSTKPATPNSRAPPKSKLQPANVPANVRKLVARIHQFESGDLVRNLRLEVASLRAAQKVASEEIAARDSQLKTLGASLARSEEARDAAEVRRAVALQQQAAAHRKVRDEKEKECARQLAALKAQIAVLDTDKERFKHDLALIVDIRNKEVAETQQLRNALSRLADTVKRESGVLKEAQLREAVCTTALNKLRRELDDGSAVEGAVAASAASGCIVSGYTASGSTASSHAFRHAASRIGPNLVPIHDAVAATGRTLASCAEECFVTCNTSRRLLGTRSIVVRGECGNEFEKKFKGLPLAAKARELHFCVHTIIRPHCGWLTAHVLQYKRLFIKMQCELHMLGTALRTENDAHAAATKLDEIMECARDALPTFGDAMLPVVVDDLDDHCREGVGASAKGEH